MAGPSADALTLRLDNIEDSLAAALSLLRSLTNNTASRPRQVRRAAAAAAAAASPDDDLETDDMSAEADLETDDMSHLTSAKESGKEDDGSRCTIS